MKLGRNRTNKTMFFFAVGVVVRPSLYFHHNTTLETYFKDASVWNLLGKIKYTLEGSSHVRYSATHFWDPLPSPFG